MRREAAGVINLNWTNGLAALKMLRNVDDTLRSADGDRTRDDVVERL